MIRGTLTVTLSEAERRIIVRALSEESCRLRTENGRVLKDISSLSEGRVRNIQELLNLKDKISE